MRASGSDECVLCNPKSGCLTAPRHQHPKIAESNNLEHRKPGSSTASRTHHPPSRPPPSPIRPPEPAAAMFSRQVLRSVRAAAPQRALALRAAPVRSFAAAAAPTEVKAPVAVFGVDGTYATALVIAASRPESSRRPTLGPSRPFSCPVDANWLRECLRRVPVSGQWMSASPSLTFLRQFSTRLPSRPRASTPRPTPSPTSAPSSRRTPSWSPSSPPLP